MVRIMYEKKYSELIDFMKLKARECISDNHIPAELFVSSLCGYFFRDDKELSDLLHELSKKGCELI